MLGEYGVAGNPSSTVPPRQLDAPPPFVFAPSASTARTRAGRRIAAVARAIPWPICAITAAAAVLRLASLGGVSPNQFYDAAVRSMSVSWHNFFFGAFDPAATLSIDKPPLDLWLQVLSVKLFGWGRFSLQLPEALGGTLSVPLLYDAVRRVAGRPAGLAAAAALAVFPESVLTSRSDTMDSVMMLLVIAALWLTIRAALDGRRRWIVLAGVALGLAFNVKLLEALIAVPALVTMYMLARRASWQRKARDLGFASVALVGVGLSWAVAASLAPGRHPWPVGSTDGTVWNAMFVFNGFGRVSGAASTKPGGPGPFRLLVSTGWHYDLLLGCVLFASLAIGIAAAIVTARDRSRPRRSDRLARAFAIALAVWIAFALFVFDTMTTVHARYLEVLAPALAAAIGFGAAALAGLHRPGAGGRAGGRGRARRGDRESARAGPPAPSILAIVLALGATCAYTFSFRPPRVASGAVALIFAAVGAALLARAGGRLGEAAKWLTAGLIVSCALTFPVHETVSLVRSQANDSLGLATAPSGNIVALSRYLAPRTVGVRYELAADEPLALAPLIIRDQRPILPLTSFNVKLVGVDRLLAAIRSGAVRYGVVANAACDGRAGSFAPCTDASLWIRRHGIDVTPQVGLSGRLRVYLLDPARAG